MGIFDRPELAHKEVRIVHKLLVRWPDGSLPLLPPLNGSLLLGVEDVDLFHGREVDHAIEAEHYPGKLLLFSTFEPAVEFGLDGHRLVIWVELPVWLAFYPRIGTGIVKPPEVFECEAGFLKYITHDKFEGAYLSSRVLSFLLSLRLVVIFFGLHGDRRQVI